MFHRSVSITTHNIGHMKHTKVHLSWEDNAQSRSLNSVANRKEFHYRVRYSPAAYPIPSHVSPVHKLTTGFLEIHIIIIFIIIIIIFIIIIIIIFITITIFFEITPESYRFFKSFRISKLILKSLLLVVKKKSQTFLKYLLGFYHEQRILNFTLLNGQIPLPLCTNKVTQCSRAFSRCQCWVIRSRFFPFFFCEDGKSIRCTGSSNINSGIWYSVCSLSSYQMP